MIAALESVFRPCFGLSIKKFYGPEEEKEVTSDLTQGSCVSMYVTCMLGRFLHQPTHVFVRLIQWPRA